MNYIKKIQAQNIVMKKGLRLLKNYVSSPKFLGDGRDFVNPKDILLRVNEILNKADDIEMESVLETCGICTNPIYNCSCVKDGRR